MTSDLITKAIEAVSKGISAYCKFLSANDSGETKGHQSGILISINAKSMLFTDKELKENHILKRTAKIKWQDDYITDCTFTWYESKKELRITGFGRGKSPLKAEYTGALFVLIKDTEEDFQGFILNTDDDIQDFLEFFGLTPAETNKLIEYKEINLEEKENIAINKFIDSLTVDFPSAFDMSLAARTIHNNVYNNVQQIITNPDSILLKWTEEEFRLFRAIEQARYGHIVFNGFKSVEDFIVFANQVLNRRKSRAGKSLEYHLSAIFDGNKISYTSQCVTEGKKRPDFLFPSKEAYYDTTFSIEKICTLAAKTTCKDRWRQILNEANRLRDQNKYLCTMQQGISSDQMDEMESEKVVLVVPEPYITYYPKEKRSNIWTLTNFVNYVKEMEGIS